MREQTMGATTMMERLPSPAGDAVTNEGRRNGARAARGSLSFVPPAARTERARSLVGRQGLVVDLGDVPAAARGRLGELVESAVEAALAARGAAAPGVGTDASLAATLDDQLFRARRVGAKSLCFAFGSLRAACSCDGAALEPEDSALLRDLAAMSRRLPLHVLLADTDAGLGAYGPPRALAAVLAPSPESFWGDAEEDLALLTEAPTRATAVPASAEVEPEPATDPEPAIAEPVARTMPSLPSVEITPLPIPIAATRPPESATVKGWVSAIAAARGPQPLAAFERLFADAYVPLGAALARGQGDAEARAVHAELQAGFGHIYREACPSFASGRRPRLVLDIFDLAARAARLHGARATHLLLVDSLRYDVGMLVKNALLAALDGRASLTDEHLLWSALPTSTGRQLDGLARGLDALRTPDPDRQEDTVRGRSAEIIRRLRVGSREVFKLDVVEAKLAEVGPSAMAALPGIAAAVAQVIRRHIEHLPPRTLLVVFGDHGFTVGDDGHARSGGATPEEVLVPAFAFLVGDVH